MEFLIRQYTEDAQLWILMAVLSFDIISGFAKALATGTFDSAISKKGLIIHAMIGLLVIGLSMAAVILRGSMWGTGALYLYTVATTGFSISYGASIIENLDEMGVPVPDEITKYLANIKSKGGDKNEWSIFKINNKRGSKTYV